MTNSGYEMQLAEKNDRIAELKRKLANEQARDIHSCHPNCTREGCVNRRLRAELAAAFAACKAKDEALESCGFADDSTDPEMCGSYYDAELVQRALAIKPDDAALKAWLGEPVAWEFTDAFGTHYTDDQRDWMDTPGIESVTPLYSPKGLK